MLLQAPGFVSERLVHGCSTRHGGRSQGHYASMNLGHKWGDDPGCVDDNFSALAKMGGFSVADLVMVKQVHGAQIVRACEIQEDTQADGIYALSDDPGPKVLGVRTADCVPILLASRSGDRFAALHSGWRGTVSNIVEQGVRHLCEIPGRTLLPSELCAVIGPCIEVDAFEVGTEVAEQFPSVHRYRYASGRWHVDLVGMVFAQLRAAGLEPEMCVRVGSCTHANPEDFFSYRRDGRPTGQMLSFIGIRAF